MDVDGVGDLHYEYGSTTFNSSCISKNKTADVGDFDVDVMDTNYADDNEFNIHLIQKQQKIVILMQKKILILGLIKNVYIHIQI